ncbi:unnamed protein product [marine sediment metagenome]|uniref:Uncharacterized protein n=1 Tax=marine sediment metagenome TaxID=412755 RepID=X1HHC4_9ZZZZ
MLYVRCGIIGNGSSIEDPYRPAIHGCGNYVALYKPDLTEVLTSIEPATPEDDTYIKANHTVLIESEAQALGVEWVPGFATAKFVIREPRVTGLMGLAMRELKPIVVSNGSEIHQVEIGQITFGVKVTVT